MAAPRRALSAQALRALQRERELAPGERRRLFRLLDRTARAGLVDRYVRWLVRHLANSDLPLRRIMVAIWATGRHQALIDFVARERRARFADPDTFRFFADRSIHFDDHAAAVPIFAHLLSLTPGDAALRLALIRGQTERGAFVEAARVIAEDTSGTATRAGIATLATAMSDGLLESTSTATDAIPAAIALIAPLDPGNALLRDIARTIATAAPRSDPFADQTPQPVPHVSVLPGERCVDRSPLAIAVDDLARQPTRSPAARALRRRVVGLIADVDPFAIAPLLDRLLAVAPRFAEPVAARFDDAEDAIALFAGLDPHLPLAVWRTAMTHAERAGSPGALAGFALIVASKPGVPLAALHRAGEIIARHCDDRARDAFWLSAAETARSLPVAIAALRALLPVADSPGSWLIAAGLIDGSLREGGDSARLVEATRLILARGWRRNDAAPLSAATVDPALSAALQLWLRAVIAWAQGDRVAALDHIEAGIALNAADAPVSFIAERALLNWRFGHWGAAAVDLPAIDQRRLRGVHTHLSDVAALHAAMPLAPQDNYPECLIDAMFDRPPTAAYTPVPRSVVTIITALAAGGSEKQAVSVVAALAREPRVARQTMLVRSLATEQHAFFLPRVIEAGVTHEEFGQHPADAAAVLAATGDAPGSRLAAALGFLPDWLQSTCALVPLLRELCPAVVHIRQDYVAAALASVLAGVPRVLMHRGSLSPDHWGLRPPQVLARVRPMRHVYRRLLDHPGFAFVNNSVAGLDTDRAWLERDDVDRFHLVHNVVDFAKLGDDDGPNPGLRATLGIPADAPVIGAAFRFQKVKRPLLWLAAARALLDLRPDAHFLIVGDGELRDEMTAFAASAGFLDRLHLPGTVEDVGPWYRAMTIALLTSDREGLPNLLIEAQHFGVPVVSTDVGGARETMDVGRTGRLVPIDTPPAGLAAAIASMLDDRPWYAAASAAAPAYVHQRFGAATAVARLMRLYGFEDADGPT